MSKLEQEKQVLLKKFHSLWVQSIGTPKHNKEEWKEVTWDEALDFIAEKMMKIKSQYGPESVALFSDPLVVVAPTGHRLAGKRLQPRAVAGEPWISHKADSVTRRQVESFFASHGLRLRVAMEISNPEVIVRLVEARLGLAALPLRAVRREVREGRLVVLPVQGFRLERSSGLMVRSGGTSGRVATAFRSLLRPGKGLALPAQ
jgi:DNA-binding transcriptional LysR family regulator